MILVIGVKGGVGTTTVALALARHARAVGLDAADGQLAARLDRPALALEGVGPLFRHQFSETVDRIVRKRLTLLWSPACRALPAAMEIVRAVEERTEVVADGGIEPPQEIAALAQVVVIVTADGEVAAWHERTLRARFPAARVVRGSGREQIAALINELELR